ncbi:MAG: type I glyceraldehyde-3-phosphate dehydrogenase [Halobacteriovoraceae bacterium]|jgi:glyceraldehyde 3-phosphate dehydrogenase|nr:type I glyceraldehyde-3-phosphate dehydrogenase [Halobacteriovoraceae bacterium]MBT5093746.1 type I glyceraldehyde-3-phosphate dehydrogenase [Halobacteriovoraceae bacterium]
MAPIKVGINGMGRIGRTILREIFNKGLEDKIQIVAVNNPGIPDPYLHLLKYDSVHGRFGKDVHFDKKDHHKFFVDQKEIAFHAIKDPAEIPWSDQGVQIVIDATGRFKDQAGLGRHISGSVKKVIMCAPGKDLDGTFVVGINHETYDPSNHHIVSNASCTTNCLAPVAKVLHEKFGIVNGFMTTIHAYTSDQQLLDGSHLDLRRARAAALSMIPTTTGAARAVGLVIPELEGKLDGYAVRVPAPDTSLVDLSVNLEKTASAEQINAALKEASQTYLKGILEYTDEELVSVDFTGMRESSCVDGGLTNVIGNTAKVVAWYDNEAGFSNRVIDLAQYMGERL